MSAASAVLAVRAGGVEFGVPVDRVRSVLRPPPLSRLPHVGAGVRGIASVRGEFVAVIDLAQRLGLGAAAEPGRMVVVEAPSGRGALALWVDDVLDIVAADEPLHPPEEAEIALEPHHLAGVLSPAPDRLVTLLDLNSVLTLEPRSDEEPR